MSLTPNTTTLADILTFSATTTKRQRNDIENESFSSTGDATDTVAATADETPRYVTRQTLREMAKETKSLTERELAKLQRPATPPPPHAQQVPPTAAGDALLHQLMVKYADKQHAMCEDICNLNQRLQKSMDENLRLKETERKTRTDYEDQLSHLREISTSYEQDIEELETTLANQKKLTEKQTLRWKSANDSFYTLLFVMGMALMTWCALTHTALHDAHQRDSITFPPLL